ncbi:MAG: NPCBM/NEW2 domain-containing protein [Armatimonadota bacterium]
MNYFMTLGLVMLAVAVQAAPVTVPLSSLQIERIEQGWGTPHANQSVDGNPIKLGGTSFATGIGTHANSIFAVKLSGKAVRFTSSVGIDDEKTGTGHAVFSVWANGKKLAESPMMRGGQKAHIFDLDVSKLDVIVLKVDTDNIDSAHADWADAMVSMVDDSVKPEIIATPADKSIPVIAHIGPGKPRINGPSVVGCTPGYDFVYLVPVSAACPVSITAKGLPAGLTIDSKTGIITGRVKSTGDYNVSLKVSGALGSNQRSLKIVAGKGKLALTPPMGWNSWNCWAGAIDDSKVRAAADAFVKSGLAAHGYQFVNIDDCWQAGRDASGNVVANSKFPNMPALADYVHSKGLKVGLYSSPGPQTCGGYEGSYQHEEQDAATWAAWGFDYVKYDWCSYGSIAKPGLAEMIKPYRVMRKALDKAPRDIVFSYCQYGMGEPWKWGPKEGGNLWRTTGDITDSWGSMTGTSLWQTNIAEYSSPGHWNDPDMLVLGWVGWGPSLHPTRLTAQEQLTHMTLWCINASPLLIGCDLNRLDSYTLDLLTNDEVLAVNQDALGKGGKAVLKRDEVQVWMKTLADGSTALAVINLNWTPVNFTFTLKECGLPDGMSARDLWKQKSAGSQLKAMSVKLGGHGSAMYKLSKPKK